MTMSMPTSEVSDAMTIQPLPLREVIVGLIEMRESMRHQASSGIPAVVMLPRDLALAFVEVTLAELQQHEVSRDIRSLPEQTFAENLMAQSTRVAMAMEQIDRAAVAAAGAMSTHLGDGQRAKSMRCARLFAGEASAASAPARVPQGYA